MWLHRLHRLHRVQSSTVGRHFGRGREKLLEPYSGGPVVHVSALVGQVVGQQRRVQKGVGTVGVITVVGDQTFARGLDERGVVLVQALHAKGGDDRTLLEQVGVVADFSQTHQNTHLAHVPSFGQFMASGRSRHEVFVQVPLPPREVCFHHVFDLARQLRVSECPM